VTGPVPCIKEPDTVPFYQGLRTKGRDAVPFFRGLRSWEQGVIRGNAKIPIPLYPTLQGEKNPNTHLFFALPALKKMPGKPEFAPPYQRKTSRQTKESVRT
jgi:hypothetical protein